ncbi:hypothetical protein MNBD_NITROSPIRAE02-1592 [hydrothermal vent metagenome]|uniref:Uncharacterized protein n=1 Tax=hydrothermal vent metagenome TaxID=652676 RepID=A0A3B1CJL0_9ZZZZ
MEKLIPQIRSLGSRGKGCGVHTPLITGEPKHPSGHPPYLRGSDFSSTPQGGLLLIEYRRILEAIIRKIVISHLFSYSRITINAIIFMVFNTFGGKIDKYRGFLIPVLGVICSRYSEYRVNTRSSCQSTALLEPVHIKQTS